MLLFVNKFNKTNATVFLAYHHRQIMKCYLTPPLKLLMFILGTSSVCEFMIIAFMFTNNHTLAR